MEKIIPIFIGDAIVDIDTGGIVKYGKVLDAGYLPDFPEICVTSIEREVRQVFDKEAIVFSEKSRTVKEIMSVFMGTQGFKVEGDAIPALEKVQHGVVDVLSIDRKVSSF